MEEEEGEGVISVGERLVLACQNGDAAALQSLMTSSVSSEDLTVTTEDGATLITNTIIGAGSGGTPEGQYPECLQLLLDTSLIDLDTVDTVYGRTAAHWTVFHKRHDLLLQLMSAGANMVTPDFTGTSPFHLAISERANLCLEAAIRNQPREILEFPDTNGNSPLERAIQVGNVEGCKLLVEAGASVNTINQQTGQSPLHLAARDTSIAVIELLLNHEAVLDLNDSEGMTPIHLASVAGSRESLVVTVKFAGDAVLSLPNAINGMTPLMYACLHGNQILVKYLMKKKVSGGEKDVEGKTALHWAAQSNLEGASGCLQLLLKKHKDLIETKDSYGLTPLHCAAMSGDIVSINLLLSAGADVLAVDNDNHTVGHWATLSGQVEAIHTVLGAGGITTLPDSQGAYPVHYAAQGSNSPLPDDDGYTEEAHLHSLNMQECLKLILEQNGDPDVRDSQGMTPLHWALQFPNNQTACTILLNGGADPKAKDNDGQTGLHLSARSGWSQNCQYIIEYTGGAIAKELDNQGQSALFAAVESGQLDCVEYLLQMNLSPFDTNEEGRSPAHVAATSGWTDCLGLLKSYGGDLSLRSVHGATCLHEAAANGNNECLEYLLASGLPPDDEAGPSGATALHYAATGAHGQCVHTLLKYGADINALATTEEEKLTPLDYCSEYPELAEYLRNHGAMTGIEISPPHQEEVEEEMKEDTESPLQEDDIISDQSKEGREEVKEGGEEEGEVRVRKTSRPPTADRRSLTWEGTSGGGGGRGEEEEVEVVKKEEEERGRMRRLSLQSAEGTSIAGMVKPKLLERALSVLKTNRPPPLSSSTSSSSIFHSVVGFFAAHTTVLAATLIGEPLGSKVTEVAEKVATDTAEDLRNAAGSFEGVIPDLQWLREPQYQPPEVIPELRVERPTPPPSPPPPPLHIHYEVMEKRLRKAKAQMDMTKSTGYRAVEELLKAQSTHTTLRRQFEESRLAELAQAKQEAFAEEEAREKETSDDILRKLNGRIKRADKQSEQVHRALDRELAVAREENEKLRGMMGDMGVSPRPTVAQWLAQKQLQKKKAMQEALINWDRTRPQRDTAILVQQLITSQRALKHAAWGASKHISSKIKSLKQEELLGMSGVSNGNPRQPSSMATSRRVFSRPSKSVQSTGRKLEGPPSRRRHGNRPPSIPVREKRPIRSKSVDSDSTVRATPHGFLKIKEGGGGGSGRGVVSSPRQQDANMWSRGHGFALGSPTRDSYMRATGPKTVHAQRSLHFLPPNQFRDLKLRERDEEEIAFIRGRGSGGGGGGGGGERGGGGGGERGGGGGGGGRSFLKMKSLEFGGSKKVHKGRRASFGNTTLQYHSLADSLSRRRTQLPRQRSSSVEIPVIPMNVLKATPMTPPPVNC